MKDNVLLNKVAIIEKCINRINEEYGNGSHEFYDNQAKQDSVILNFQRACEITLSLTAHIVKSQNWGLPQDHKETFQILTKKKFIDSTKAKQLQKIADFPNIALREYQSLKPEELDRMIKEDLTDLQQFSKTIANFELK